jgi:hypothetical protein
MPESRETSGKDPTHEALLRMLRPMVSFCLRHSLVVQTFIEAVKQVYEEVAAEQLRKSGDKVNVSRLSVITGLHRRDVRRLLRPRLAQASTPSLIGRVIGQWEQDPRYATKRGKPRLLKHDMQHSEFKALVSEVSTDLNPGTVLFELERIGAVERVGSKLRLAQGAYLLSGNVAQGMDLMARDTADLVSAVCENLEEHREPKNLHARTEYDNIALEALPRVRAWLLEEGALFHQKMRDFLSQFDLDLHPEAGQKGGGRAAVVTVSLTVEPPAQDLTSAGSAGEFLEKGR